VLVSLRGPLSGGGRWSYAGILQKASVKQGWVCVGCEGCMALEVSQSLLLRGVSSMAPGGCAGHPAAIKLGDLLPIVALAGSISHPDIL
jgi:hypothetical protein